MENADRIHRNFVRPFEKNEEAIVTAYYYCEPKFFGRYGRHVIDAPACAIAPEYPTHSREHQP